MNQRSDVMMPYVMSKMPDPFNISWSGDWSVCSHSWASLVGFTPEGDIEGVIAESWAHSSDLRTWRFKLRRNRRWSDGSAMTAENIIASFSASAAGTSHSNFGNAIETIEAEGEDEIVFRLKQAVPSFLVGLSYPDWSIVHPSTFKVAGNAVQITGLTPCSGSFCIDHAITNSENSVVGMLLKRNSFFPGRFRNDLQSGALKTYSDCNTLLANKDTLLSFRAYSEALTSSCINALTEAGFVISRTHPSWILKADFTRKGLAGVPKAQRQKIQVGIQRLLSAGAVQFGVTKSTGLRPLASEGSLSLAEFKEVINRLDEKTKEVVISLPVLKIATMDIWQDWKSLKWLMGSFEKLGVKAELTVFTRDEYAKKSSDQFLQNNFDLLFIPLGSGDPDPDSNFQIARKYLYPSLIEESELTKAFYETDLGKRDQIYQSIAVHLLEEGAIIPLMNDADFVGIHESISASFSPSFRHGITLYDLAF